MDTPAQENLATQRRVQSRLRGEHCTRIAVFQAVAWLTLESSNVPHVWLYYTAQRPEENSRSLVPSPSPAALSASMMKMGVLALLSLAVLGCTPQQSKDQLEASCQLDAGKAKTEQRIGEFIELCMREHGYRLNLTGCPAQQRVEPSTPVTSIITILDEQEENPACYEGAS